VLSLWSASSRLVGAPAIEEAARDGVARAYFHPAEDELIGGWFARYLTVREGLLEVIEEPSRRVGPLRGLSEPAGGEGAENRARWRGFIAGYTAACLVVRVDRYLAETLAVDNAVQRKLNEGSLENRVPRKRYTRVFESLTAPDWGVAAGRRGGGGVAPDAGLRVARPTSACDAPRAMGAAEHGGGGSESKPPSTRSGETGLMRARIRLTRFAASFEASAGQTLPAPTPGMGRARSLLLVGLWGVFAMPALAAAVHHHLVHSPAAAMWVAAGLSMAGGIVVWPARRAWLPDPWTAAVWAVSTVLVGGIVLVQTSAPAFHGIPSHSGGDLGTHLMFYRQMTELGAATYRGMVAPYMQMMIADGLGVGAPLAVIDAVYDLATVVLIGGLAFASFVGWTVRIGGSSRPTAEASSISVPAFAAGGLATALVVLPLVSYYEQDGFLAQVVAAGPLLVGLCAYASARVRVVRVGVLMILAPALRYTYALNVGDVLLAAAVLVAIETREARQTGVDAQRVQLLSRLTLALGLAALVVYVPIYGRHDVPGGYVAVPIGPQARGLVALGLASLISRWLVRDANPSAGTQGRLALAGGLIVLIPGLILSIWIALDLPVDYYVRKYGFAGTIVAGTIAVPCSVRAVLAAAADQRAKTLGPSVAVVTLGLHGALDLAEHSRPHRGVVVERAPGATSVRHAGSFAEPAVIEVIRATLVRHDAAFGGLLTNRWPESQFTNAWLGEDAGRLQGQFVTHGMGLKGPSRGTTPLMAPGHCVFAYDPRGELPSGPNSGWPVGGRESAMQLVLDPAADCEPVEIVGQPDRAPTICARCYDDPPRYLYPFAPESGPYEIERSDDRPELPWRWTDGSAHVDYITSSYDAGRECEVYVNALGDRPFEILLDGERLGPGKVQRIPGKPLGSQHRFTIRSPVFVPAEVDPQVGDRRPLGVSLSHIELRCGAARPQRLRRTRF
jgi:hypothetical protein